MGRQALALQDQPSKIEAVMRRDSSQIPQSVWPQKAGTKNANAEVWEIREIFTDSPAGKKRSRTLSLEGSCFSLRKNINFLILSFLWPFLLTNLG
jgi:hypothetical protein